MNTYVLLYKILPHLIVSHFWVIYTQGYAEVGTYVGEALEFSVEVHALGCSD